MELPTFSGKLEQVKWKTHKYNINPIMIVSMGLTKEDKDFEEFHAMFLQEFESLLDDYSKTLKRLRPIEPVEERLEGYSNLFRIFHTMKGAAGYFKDYYKLSEFSEIYCEAFRNMTPEKAEDFTYLNWARKGFTQLSSAFFAIRRGSSLDAYRFIVPPHNLRD